jgi:phosphoglycolate phosphatase
VTYRLAIFDLDGTLANTFPWFVGALDEAAQRFGFHRPDAIEVDGLRTCGPLEILNRLGVPLWKVPLIARYMRAAKASTPSATPLFPGVDTMLRRLSSAGTRLAMVSSDSEANVRAVLGPSNADLIMEFACEASLFGKAAHLRRVLRLSRVPAGEAIYIGDEVRDADAARQVGLAFGAVSWGFADPETLRAEQPAIMFEHIGAIADLLAPECGQF